MPRRPKERTWFRTKDPKDYVVYRDREALLGAIREEAPEVLDSLRTEVLPLWAMAYAPLTWVAMETLAALNNACREGEDLSELMSAVRHQLVRWAEQFYLNVPWVLDAAIRTLHHWLRHPEVAAHERSARWLWWAPMALLCEDVATGGPRERPPSHAPWLVRWQVLGESAQTIAEVEDRRRKDFGAAKIAYEKCSPLATPAEREAACDRFAKATAAVLRAEDMRRLGQMLSREPFRVANTQDLAARAPAIIAQHTAVAEASLKAEHVHDRHTPWSTIDLAVREYAKRISLPLRSHPRGRKPHRSVHP